MSVLSKTTSKQVNAASPMGRFSKSLRQYGSWYLFLAPAFLLFLVFHLAIWIFLIVLSLSNWSLLGDPTWAGFDNYVRLAEDPVLLKSVRNTIYYAFMFVVPIAGLSLGLAMLVNQKIRGLSFFRAAFFLPVVTSISVLAIIWSWLLIPRPTGPLNYLIGLLGIPPQDWLTSLTLALPVLTGMTLWTRMGYFMLLWLAGLQAIPTQMYEAARIDGANSWHIFWRITLPLLKPTTVFIVIISTIEAFRMFGPVFILTGGGPANATTTLVYYIWQAAFSRFDMGYAAAVSVLLFVMILIVALIQRRYLGWGQEAY